MIFIRRWRNKSMTAPLCWRGNQYQSCVATFLLQTQFNHWNGEHWHLGDKRGRVFITRNIKAEFYKREPIQSKELGKYQSSDRTQNVVFYKQNLK